MGQQGQLCYTGISWGGGFLLSRIPCFKPLLRDSFNKMEFGLMVFECAGGGG